MQDYGSDVSSKSAECRDGKVDSARAVHHQGEGFQATSHQYPVMAQKNFGKKVFLEAEMAS